MVDPMTAMALANMAMQISKQVEGYVDKAIPAMVQATMGVSPDSVNLEDQLKALDTTGFLKAISGTGGIEGLLDTFTGEDAEKRSKLIKDTQSGMLSFADKNKKKSMLEFEGSDMLTPTEAREKGEFLAQIDGLPDTLDQGVTPAGTTDLSQALPVSTQTKGAEIISERDISLMTPLENITPGQIPVTSPTKALADSAIGTPSIAQSAIDSPVDPTGVDSGSFGLSEAAAIGQLLVGLAQGQSIDDIDGFESVDFAKGIYDDAKQRAEVGLPQEQIDLGKLEIEERRQADISNIMSGSSGSAGSALSRSVLATSKANIANLGLTIADQQLKTTLAGQADAIGMNVAGLMVAEDKFAVDEYSKAQEGAAGLISSGLKNLEGSQSLTEGLEGYKDLIGLLG